MNEQLEDIRRISVNAADIDAVVARARARVMAQLVATPKTHTKAAMWWGVGGGIGLVAAATTTALVLSPFGATAPLIVASPDATQSSVPTQKPSETAPAPTATIEPQPAEPAPMNVQAVFAKAATAASQEQLAPGQYRKIASRETYLNTFAYSGDGGALQHNVGRTEADGAFEILHATNRFLRGDAASSSIYEDTGEYWVGREWGAVEPGVEQDTLDSMSATGRFVDDDAAGGIVRDTISQVAPWDQLSRDPAALLAQIRSYVESDPANTEIDLTVRVIVMRALEANVGPADVRSALLTAAGTLEFVHLTGVDGDVATINWEWAFEGRPDHYVVKLDMATGYVTSMEWWSDYPAGDVVPDDVPGMRTDMVVSIVNEAPAPTE